MGCEVVVGGSGVLQMRSHVFEKIFELRVCLERRIVGERRKVRMSRRMRRKAGGLVSGVALWEVREGKEGKEIQ